MGCKLQATEGVYGTGAARWVVRSGGGCGILAPMGEAVARAVRELAAEETHRLRRAVSADGRTDLPTMRHPLDDAPGTWHLGAVDAEGEVIGISTFFTGPCPLRPDARPAVQLQFMAVDPTVQRRGAGSAIMTEAIRSLRATDAVLLWASARDVAVPFYERFGFTTIEGSQATPGETVRPHRLIELDLA